MRKRHAANATGDWYVDTECINCKAHDLAAYSFEWVFAGHGGSKQLPRDEMRARLIALTERMAAH